MTSHHRGLLVLLALGAMQAQAQERMVQPNRRRLVVPVKVDRPADIPEVRLMPGVATTLHLPRPVRPGGLTLGQEAQGKIKVNQSFPTDIILSASSDLGLEQVSFTAATEEGRPYQFKVTTESGVWDSEVTVAFEKPAAEQMTVGSVVESLFKEQVLRFRDYGRPEQATARPDDAELEKSFWVKSAVRRGNHFFILVKNQADEAWAVQEARLTGSNGVELTVVDLFWGGLHGTRATNVIVAEVPEEVDGDYTLKKIILIGRDGQVMTSNKEVVLP